MNAVKHAEISVKRWGGTISDYYPIHYFMDSTKELCSDNRHQVIIPIFGHTLTNSDQKKINVKDLCERDHILPDYRNRFIPTLGDFVRSMDETLLPPDYLSNFILPRIFQSPVKLQSVAISPADFFNAMKFEMWMDNGAAIPASAQSSQPQLINI